MGGDAVPLNLSKPRQADCDALLITRESLLRNGDTSGASTPSPGSPKLLHQPPPAHTNRNRHHRRYPTSAAGSPYQTSFSTGGPQYQTASVVSLRRPPVSAAGLGPFPYRPSATELHGSSFLSTGTIKTEPNTSGGATVDCSSTLLHSPSSGGGTNVMPPPLPFDKVRMFV